MNAIDYKACYACQTSYMHIQASMYINAYAHVILLCVNAYDYEKCVTHV